MTWEEIEEAIESGKTINKYGDPIEGPRTGLTLDECEDVHRDDPGLLYVG